jgi:hypothetical protein
MALNRFSESVLLEVSFLEFFFEERLLVDHLFLSVSQFAHGFLKSGVLTLTLLFSLKFDFIGTRLEAFEVLQSSDLLLLVFLHVFRLLELTLQVA